jgi:hypothetical protein
MVQTWLRRAKARARMCVLGKINRLADRSCVFECCKVAAAPAKPSTKTRSMALSRSEPPRPLSIGDKAIECLGRASAAVEPVTRFLLRSRVCVCVCVHIEASSR